MVKIELALENCLVLDFSRLLPGPYCSMILADHGARVIAIEDQRFKKDGLDITQGVNRNKEHMTLNLKTQEGKDILFSLAKKADVFIEGFRPGVTKRLGIDYDTLKKINPKLVYCSLTGYGQSGEKSNKAGHDVNFLGQSGVLSLIGYNDRCPCIPGIQIADMIGGMNAAIGILLALHARQKTKQGQYIDVSMTDSSTSLLPLMVGMFQKSGKLPLRGDNLLSHHYACYNVYLTKDDKLITVGALEPRFWQKLCNLLSVPEYAPLQFDEEKRIDLIESLGKIFLTKERKEWMKIMEDQDVCVGEVLDIKELLNSEHIKQREMIVEVGKNKKISVLGIPIKLSETPGSIRTSPPIFGEHTFKILEELGYSKDKIQELVEEGVI